jgi:hypothetical protein
MTDKVVTLDNKPCAEPEITPQDHLHTLLHDLGQVITELEGVPDRVLAHYATSDPRTGAKVGINAEFDELVKRTRWLQVRVQNYRARQKLPTAYDDRG